MIKKRTPHGKFSIYPAHQQANQEKLQVVQKNQRFFQEKAKALDAELEKEKVAHQQTQVELLEKATELECATQQCEAFRLAFRTYSSGLPEKAKTSFHMLVTNQLASIQQQAAQKQAAWCEKNAVKADEIAAEHIKKASMLRAKAETVRAKAKKDQETLRAKQEELQQEQRAKANEVSAGEPLKKKKKNE
jgi:hypothetical protein